MENTNSNSQHPSPAAERRSTLGWWITVIGLLSIICCLLTCVGGYIAYNFTDIMNQVNELVEFDFDPSWGEVRPEGNNPASPADETDVDPANTLPNGDELVIPDGTVILVCGRQLPNGETIEMLVLVNQTFIESGAPLQEYYSQLVTQHNAIRFEELTGVTIADDIEALNDACQWVIYEGLDGTTYIMEIPRSEQESVLTFWNVSHITMDWTTDDVASFKVCRHDTGKPGTWVGDGKDCIKLGKLGVDTFVFDEYWTSDFDPYYTSLMDNPLSNNDFPFNNKAEIWFSFTKSR